MCKERVTLYGMTVVADRQILLSSVGTESATELARELFIRHGLVEGDWRTHHAFLQHNKEALAEAAETESKLRRRGIIADDDVLAAFYEERIPAGITSGRHFDSWWKKERQVNPHLLDFTQELLLGGESAGKGDFPAEWVQGDLTLPLDYSFNPGSYGDGITVTIPVALLPQVSPRASIGWCRGCAKSWLPGLSVRCKRIRRQLVPAPDVARQILPLLPEFSVSDSGETVPAGAPSFSEAFGAAVLKLRGFEVDAEAWKECELPPHLQMRFRVRSERGAVLDEGYSLEALQMSLAPRAKSAVQSVVKGAVELALEEAQEGIAVTGSAGQSGTGRVCHARRHPRSAGDGRGIQ